jgi:hypothetical protein
MGAYVAAYGGDLSALVCASRPAAGQPPYEAVRVGFGPDGYDGQFYYALARAPWRTHHSGIDLPAFRHLRLLYPALSWLLSGGDKYVLLGIMPLVNLAAVAGLTVLGARLALRQGLSPWWGFWLPLAANAGMPALRNLSDPLATLAAFGLLAAWLQGSRGGVVLLWALAAVFAREQNVALVGLLVLAAAWQRRLAVAAGLGAVLLLWITWVGVLRVVYGAWPFPVGAGAFDLPLVGFLTRCRASFFGGTEGSRVIHALGLGFVTLEVVLALYVASRPINRLVSAVLLVSVLFALLGGPAIYSGTWSYARVFVWLPLGIWLGCVQTRQRWPVGLLGLAVFWEVFAVTRAWMG